MDSLEFSPTELDIYVTAIGLELKEQVKKQHLANEITECRYVMVLQKPATISMLEAIPKTSRGYVPYMMGATLQACH